MNDTTRGELMSRRAQDMARSGQFEDSLSIEMALRREGFREARQWLSEEAPREMLNSLCRAARQG